MQKHASPQSYRSRYAYEGSWDDGSIRWLLVYCLLDLPGGSGTSVRFAIEDDAHDQPAPSAVLTVADGEREVVLDTGPL